MVADARWRKAEHLVGNGTGFNCDFAVAAKLEEIGVLLRQGEAVADALGG